VPGALARDRNFRRSLAVDALDAAADNDCEPLVARRGRPRYPHGRRKAGFDDDANRTVTTPTCRHLAAFAAAAAVALLAGCVTVGGTAGPPAPAPAYRVGDRWVYHIVQGYRTKIEWDETHEVTAIGPEGITVRVTGEGARVPIDRTEHWSAPGVVLQGAVYENETDRFDPPLVRYRFPLAAGETWNQRIRDLDKPPSPYTPIVRYTQVGGYTPVATPGGTFDAIEMRVIMTVDDETFWRYGTQCNYLVWYAPAVGAAVREHRESKWRDKGAQDAADYHPGQYEDIVLVSFTRGR
jgi:hypothetical protein